MTSSISPTKPSSDPGSQVFSTTDPEQAHAYICRTYVQTSIRPIGPQAGLRMRDARFDLGPLSVEDYTYAAGLEQLTPPVGRLMVGRVVAGRWQRDTIGETRRMGRGDVCLVTQPDRPHLARWDDAVRLQIVSLDPSVLLDVAAAPGDLVPRFTALGPASSGGQRLVSSVFDQVVASALQPAARHSPLAQQGLARTLASALLETFPHSAAGEPVVRDRVDAARSRVLRAAVSYLHDHAHLDVTVAQLAEAAGATRQAVHLAFRQHLQTTPSAYLERLRLDRAHRDLVDLDPTATSVEQVARLWGFVPLEHFRRRYRLVYGTPPETTLSGAPPRPVAGESGGQPTGREMGAVGRLPTGLPADRVVPAGPCRSGLREQSAELGLHRLGLPLEQRHQLRPVGGGRGGAGLGQPLPDADRVRHQERAAEGGRAVERAGPPGPGLGHRPGGLDQQ